jgi:hypothetical protein
MTGEHSIENDGENKSPASNPTLSTNEQLEESEGSTTEWAVSRSYRAS